MVIPTSDAIFKISNEAPKDDKEWATIQDSALTLAESGNLLMNAGRAKNKDEWMKDAEALVDAGAAAFKAANAKDVNALNDINDQILTT